jgi:hypothetical protein
MDGHVPCHKCMPLDEKLRSHKGSFSFEVRTCHKGRSHYRLLKPIHTHYGVILVVGFSCRPNFDPVLLACLQVLICFC